MKILNSIRNLDSFGAPIELNFQGEQKYKTLGGGIGTILKLLITFALFCVQLVSVFAYEKLQISSNLIFEDRKNMNEALNIAEHNLGLFFFFQDPSKDAIVALDPSIGRLTMFQESY